jgi:hypothetical protein
MWGQGPTMNRKRRTIKYTKKAWSIKSLVPADFLECSYYPFAYYKLPDNSWGAKLKEIKRNWKLPTKEKSAYDNKLEEARKQAFRSSLGVLSDADYDKIKKDETLYNILLSEIYALTYNLTPIEKLFKPQVILSKDFAENLAIKAKAMNVEPYYFMTNLANELPPLYNPKRYDFNLFILGVGWERERREYEEIENKMKSQQNKLRRAS